MNARDFMRLVGQFDVSRFAIPMTIQARLTNDDAIEVRVQMSVRDAHTGEPTTVNQAESFGPEVMKMFSAEDATRYVVRLVRSAIQHELDECLLVDGKQLVDPHQAERRARKMMASYA